MAANEIHLNDIGTIFRLTIKDGDSVVDISGATTKNIIFTSPGGTSTTQAGSFTNSGTDGKLQYTSVSGDINEVGTWELQASLVMTAGTFKSDVSMFEVHRNI